jgi:hypothetical protein
MKTLLVLILTLSCAVSCLSQRTIVSDKANSLELLIKKQVICDNLERQIKDIQFATVRVFVRYKIASWLWKDGKDFSDRAEQIAVRAFNDLHENKSEIPDTYFNALEPELLTLLDRYAKGEANKLREKYKISSENELNLLDSLLSQPNGEKLAADLAIKSLSGESAPLDLMSVFVRLQQRRSPELLRLIAAVISGEETGQTRFPALTLLLISEYFIADSVPLQLQKRFLQVVVDRSRNAAQSAEGDAEGFFNLLSLLIPEILTKFPELMADAGIAHAILKTKVSRESRENQERNERIANSADELSALIDEAEKTSDKGVKYDLYIHAAYLAIKLKKFTYSITIVEKAYEIDLPPRKGAEDFRKRWWNQFMGEVVEKALQACEPDAADYAIKKITDSLAKAEGFKKKATYFADKNDTIFARTALDEAVRFVAKSEPDLRRLSFLIRLIPVTQKIAPNLVFELNELLAKSIDTIPVLNVEDQPQTENYKNHVTLAMTIDWNLLPVLTDLIKVNKIAATDLANRINKKEIKIVADYVVLMNSLTDKKIKS